MYHFIVNSFAKNGLGTSVWSRLRTILDQKNIRYTAHFIGKTSDALDIALEITTVHTDKTKVIVVVGDDGTLNEVINGISLSEEIVLGYIPIGSGSGFARALGISNDPQKALSAILKPGTYKLIDLGTITTGNKERRFLASSGAGYDAAVNSSLHTSRLAKYLSFFGLSKLAFIITGIKLVLTYKSSDSVIILDGGKKLDVRDMLFASIHNTRFEGGLMFAPKADCTDDLLDVCVFADISRLKFFFALLLAVIGKHNLIKGVRIFRCKHVQIDSMEPIPSHSDGEPIAKATSFSAFCSNEKIRMVIK